MNRPIEGYFAKILEKSLTSVAATLATSGSSVEALALYLDYTNGDRRRPLLELYYNTRERMSKPNERVSLEEWRWFIPDWLGPIAVLDESDSTRDLRDACRTWMEAENLSYTDEDKQFKSPEEIGWDPSDKRWAISKRLWAIIVAVVRELHTAGFLVTCFGASVPIVMDENDQSGPWLSSLTIEANPGVPEAEEYAAFKRTL